MTGAPTSTKRSIVSSVAGLLGIVLISWSFPSEVQAQDADADLTSAAQYVGTDVCRSCHASQGATMGETLHGQILLENPRNGLESRGCEACHGPGSAHVDEDGIDGVGILALGPDAETSMEDQNRVCLECHEKTARLYWQGSPHDSRDLGCVNCHTVMKKVSEESQLASPTVIETCTSCHTQRRAQSMRSSHMPIREGKLDCADCHNPHGSATPKLLKANSVNEVCYGCHAEKRGPFLWEHAPVVENCLNCHNPHGSNHEKLLNISKPRLCQQCHIENRHPTNPQVAGDTRFIINRSCTNCHSQIHGSNHPSGLRWHR